MTASYLAAFVVGGIAVVSALVLADVGHGDGMPYLRKRRSKSSDEDPTRSSGGFTV